MSRAILRGAYSALDCFRVPTLARSSDLHHFLGNLDKKPGRKCLGFLLAQQVWTVTVTRNTDRVERNNGMQFRLRTLMIALTIGPPVLATAWTNREFLLGVQTETSKFYIPAGLNPTAEAKLRQKLKLVKTLHSISGAAAVVFYPAAFLLQWAALRNWRDWKRPPKETRWTWIAFAAAMLLGVCCLMFVMTHPSLWGLPYAPGTSRWKPL